jgi:hypothetical protein
MVVLLLAALVAVAGPFLLSSGLEDRESRHFAARARARHAAEGAMARALWCLTRTGEEAERSGVFGPPFDSPDWDTRDELLVGFRFVPPRPPKGQKALPLPAGLDSDSFHNPNGEIWTAEVEDEQGKLNINSAPPAALGSMLASALLYVPLQAGDTSMTLDFAGAFPSDGDGRTIDGFVRVGREVMAYTSRDGNVLGGLHRGILGTDVEPHPAGVLVYDARGWAIGALRLGAGGSAGSFHSVPQILGISAFQHAAGGRSHTLAVKPEEFEVLERYLTATSYRAKADGWVRREKLLDGTWNADRRVFRVRDNSNYGPGTVVRFLDERGRVRAVRRVMSADYIPVPGPQGARVTLEYEVGFAHSGDSEMFLEAELPHPVNVNTASLPVLVACLAGVALYNGPAVSRDQALVVADRLTRPGLVIRNREDLDTVLRTLMAERVIGDGERQAILENATVPGSTRLRLGTVPFCFRAYSHFTVEASATVNHAASGRPMATHTVRQLVQMPTAYPGFFLLRSQKEFEEQMRSGFGRRVVTWPVAMIDKDSAPDESLEDNVGDVRLGTGRVGRALPGTLMTDHCERPAQTALLTPDGYSMTGGPGLSYGGASCFKLSDSSVDPGSIEFWMKCDQWGGILARAARADARDLIEISYDSRNRDLVMELADGTHEGRTVIYREPYDLEPGEWYHIRAVFKSTRLGGQVFLVDGGLTPPQGPGVYGPMTELRENLDDWSGKQPGDARDVMVESTAGFPRSGAFAIDGEVFEYTSLDGTTFRDVRRGRRYTQAVSHTAGAAVQLWGYAERVSGQIPQTSGRLAESLEANPRCRIDNPPDPGPPALPGGVDEDETTIKVDSTAAFQSSGYIWVGQECIFYEGKDATRFLRCARGQRGTTAASHRHNASLVAASMRVTDFSGYPEGSHVQIDEDGSATRVEWLSFAEKIARGGRRYLVPGIHTDRDGNKSLHAWRGHYGTGARAHAAGADLIPVFSLAGPKCGDAASPQMEPVTVTDGSGESEPARLKRAYESTSYWRNQDTGAEGWTHTWMAALDRHVSRTYSGGDCRLLKFPSGELAMRPGDLHVGRGLACSVDEIRVAGGHVRAGRLPAGFSLDQAATGIVIEMPSAAAANQVPASGLVRIDGELAYYTGRSAGTRTLPWTPRLPFRTPAPQYDTRDFPVVTLSGVRRGVLGSRVAAHAPWSPAVFLEALPATDLTARADETAGDIPLRSGAGFDDEGYALVGSEIIGYCQRGGNTLGGVYFRGAYGTVAQGHQAGTMAVPLPFRYWDRHRRESDRSELAFFQGSFTAAGTSWRGIGMLGSAASYVGVRLLVRFNGVPGWDSAPTNRDGGLYEFAVDPARLLSGTPFEFSSRTGRGVRADQIEYRLLFEYLSGATRSAAWKRTPRIDTLYVVYGNPLVVVRREVTAR